MEDMIELKWLIVVVLLMLAWIHTHTHTHTHINPIHITKLTLLYDVELTKQIGGYQKAKHFF